MRKQTFHRVLFLWLVLALIFAAFPWLDLKISMLFYKGGWPHTLSPFAKLLRNLGMILPILLALLAVINLFTQHLPRRASYFILLSGFIAPILIVNLILKDHWHRARPVQVLEFGGKFTFTPWYEIGKECVRNCSFVSGEASGVFWLIAIVFLLPPAFKKLSAIVILTFATLISLLRLSFGGHFYSDIAFAAIITYSVVYLTHKFYFPELHTHEKTD